MEKILLKNYEKLLKRKNFNKRFIIKEWSYFNDAKIWTPFDIDLSHDIELNCILGNLSFSINNENNILHFDLEKWLLYKNNNTLQPIKIQRDTLLSVFHKVIPSHFSSNPAEEIAKS